MSEPNSVTENPTETEETTAISWRMWVSIIIAVIGLIMIVIGFFAGKTWMWIVGCIVVVAAILTFILWPKEEEEKTEEVAKFTNSEIVVPTDISSLNNYNAGVDGTMQNLSDSLKYRGNVDYVDNYPPNPDLYPENGQEFLPENSMYTHLENNFLDIGPQIGVATRVNSQRNGPTLLFRKQYAVPTMPTGYWNQSTISQPIFTNNVC